MFELRPWLSLIAKRPNRLLIGGLLIFGTLLSGIALLAVSGWFITETALVGLLLAAGTAATINLYVPGGAIRFFALSRTVFRYLERVYNHDTVLRLLTDIRCTLFRTLSAASVTPRSERSGAQWLSRLTSDVDALDTIYLRLIAPTALAGLTTFCILVLTIMLFDLTTAGITGLILLVAIAVSTVGVYQRTVRLAGRRSARQDRLRDALIRHIEGFSELTAAGQIHKNTIRLMSQADQLTSAQAKTDTRVGWHQAGTHLLVNVASAVALWLGFSLYQAGMLSGPVLVLLPVALLGLAEVYAMLPDAFGKLGATIASAERLNRDFKADDQQPQPIEKLVAPMPALDARHVSIGHAVPLVTNFSLTLEQNQHVGIVGQSGCGKSTLADAIAGLVDLSAGTIARQDCAYLTQKTVIFEDTLRANLLLGCPKASDTELWRILEQVELAERFSSEPGQLDCWLGPAGSRISGGEARRVALARVLLNPAPLFILDEPFTGIDQATRERIKKTLKPTLAGKTVVAFAHGPEALPEMHQTLTL